MGQEYLLQVQNVTKQYGEKVALNDFSMDICSGEIVALIGENGAGKTTLLNIICGYSKPSAGQVQYKGKNIVANPLITREFGVLIEPQFLDYISAEENLRLLSQLTNQKQDTRIKELLEKTETILDMAHKQNVPVLFSSHDLDDVDEICDRVVMISKGNKQLDQPLEHKQTYTVKIECTISDDIKRSLMEKCGELSFFEDKIMFQDETLIIDIQKILLQKGHYICGFSVQKNNLKSLFGMEG